MVPVLAKNQEKASTAPRSLKYLKAGNLQTGSLKSPQITNGNPTSEMMGIMLARRRSLGRFPSRYLFAKPYRQMKRISDVANLTMQAENLWDSFKAVGISHLTCRAGKEEKIADPTASPRNEGLLSWVTFLGATGRLQKERKPILENSVETCFWITFVALVSEAAIIWASNLRNNPTFLCTAVGLQIAKRMPWDSGPGLDAWPTGVA